MLGHPPSHSTLKVENLMAKRLSVPWGTSSPLGHLRCLVAKLWKGGSQRRQTQLKMDELPTQNSIMIMPHTYIYIYLIIYIYTYTHTHMFSLHFLRHSSVHQSSTDHLPHSKFQNVARKFVGFFCVCFFRFFHFAMPGHAWYLGSHWMWHLGLPTGMGAWRLEQPGFTHSSRLLAHRSFIFPQSVSCRWCDVGVVADAGGAINTSTEIYGCLGEWWEYYCDSTESGIQCGLHEVKSVSLLYFCVS